MIPSLVIFIIFCGDGGLTWRKLILSLFNLHLNCNLRGKSAIIDPDRTALDYETLCMRLRESVGQFSNLGPGKAGNWKAFAARISSQRANFAAFGLCHAAPVRNDQRATLFMRNDQVEDAWAVLILAPEAWNARLTEDFPNHAADTGRAKSTAELLKRAEHAWRSKQ